MLDKIDWIMQNNRVILITSLPNHSGGKFLCTLLDGHSSLYVLPFSLHNSFPVECFSESDLSNNIDWMVYESREIYKIFDVIDEQKYRQIMAQIFLKHELTYKNYVVASYYAYFYCSGRLPDESVFVFFGHDYKRTVDFIKLFPDSLVVAMHRHPVNLYASYCAKIKRRYLQMNRIIPPYLMSDYFSSFMDFYAKKADVGLFSLEELHANPEVSLRLLSDYMDIQFEQCMMKSTMLGVEWDYNNKSGFGDLHKSINIRYGKGLIFYRMLRNYMEKMGYKDQKSLTMIDKVYSYFPGKDIYLYFVDYFKSAFGYLKNSTDKIGRKVVVIAKSLMFYFIPFVFKKMYESVFLSRKIANMDSIYKFDNVVVINKMSSSSVDY